MEDEFAINKGRGRPRTGVKEFSSEGEEGEEGEEEDAHASRYRERLLERADRAEKTTALETHPDDDLSDDEYFERSMADNKKKQKKKKASSSKTPTTSKPKQSKSSSKKSEEHGSKHPHNKGTTMDHSSKKKAPTNRAPHKTTIGCVPRGIYNPYIINSPINP